MPQPINNDTFEVKEKELREAIDFGAFHIADITPDEVLYHYTSLDSLQKILEGECFHATEYHYLNDMDEFQFVDKLLLEVLKEDFHGSKHLERFIYHVSMAMITVKSVSAELKNSYYVISFSKIRDNLTLWTEFANYGCSMGLKPYLLQNGDSPKMVYAGEVFYTTSEQKSVIRTAIFDVFNHFFERTDIKVEELPECLDALDEQQIFIMSYSIAKLVSYYGMAMKDELYAAEQEYRLIFEGKNQKVHYRQKGNMLIPYIMVPLLMEHNFPAFSSITLAPLGKGTMQVRAMVQFLLNLGLDNKDVFESRLNLRY